MPREHGEDVATTRRIKSNSKSGNVCQAPSSEVARNKLEGKEVKFNRLGRAKGSVAASEKHLKHAWGASRYGDVSLSIAVEISFDDRA